MERGYYWKYNLHKTKVLLFPNMGNFAIIMSMNKKRLVSGIKPSGRPHIGNYFGAMRQFVNLQEIHDSFIFIADYHALTTLQNRSEMSENIIEMAIDYLATGLDPEKVTLYQQSTISYHTELAWIFNCLTTMPYLMRAHAFKDSEAKNKEINVGVFDYPILMAADILLYDAVVVPVGQDQKQHIEIARDTAEKFNNTFGETFVLPEPLILENVKTVTGTDGQKMSKSYGNHIPLFATDDEIKKLVMSIVTDSGSSVPENVKALHLLFKNKKEVEKIYSDKEGKYKELKEALIEDMIAFIAPLRENRLKFEKDKGEVVNILKKGSEKANEIAQRKMKEVKEKIGVLLS